MKTILTLSLLVGLSFSILTTCSNDDENPGFGTLVIVLTDAPFPSNLLSRADVTINKIEVRRLDNSENPFLVVSEEEISTNLLDLVNGITEELVKLEIPAGEYDLVRLYFKDALVELTDQTTYDLIIPSGAQTGLKVFVKPSIIVSGGLTSELLLDFDVSQSFVPKGNFDTPAGISGFNFKPVIKASNMSTAGRLIGNVTDTLDNPIEGATVSVFIADSLNTSSFSNIDGDYTILGLLEGFYQIEVEKEGFNSVEVEHLEIVPANATTQDFELEASE